MPAVEALGVNIGHGIIVDTVAKKVADGGGVGMVVVEVACLMCVGGVEGDSLVDKGIAVPDAVSASTSKGASITATTVDVGEGIGSVKERDTIDEVANGTKSCSHGTVEGGGPAWDAVDGGGVSRKVGKVAGLGLVQIPRSHDMEAQSARFYVYPSAIVMDLMNPGVGRGGLGPPPPAPGS